MTKTNEGTTFKLLENKYKDLNAIELNKVFQEKLVKYKEFMRILKPVTFGDDFLHSNDKEKYPTWVRIAHIDEFLTCKYCQEEYLEKCKQRNIEPIKFDN